MNLEEMKKELRKLLEEIKEYRALKPDERTEEVREAQKTRMERVKQLEADIREEEELIEYEERMNATINMPRREPNPGPDFNHVEQPDQPIYRGRFALGQQMIDIYKMSTNADGAGESRSRWEQMVKREETRAAGTGQVQAVGKDGGFLLQGETSYEMMTNGFNNSVVLSRAQNRNLGNSQFVEIIGIKETSRANGSRGGGVRVYTDSELAQMTSSKTEFKKTRLEPKRLTGLYYASDEILDNAPMLQGEMSELFTEEFAFKGQDLAVNGSGVGEMLGILNAACLVSQAKESGQTAATIVHDNITKMQSRFWGRSPVWFANREILPQLRKLAIPVGTGGSVVPLYVQAQDPNTGADGTLDGFPIFFIEQAAALGTVGDLILADMSRYYVANKGGVDTASSIHLKFDYNQTAFRFVYFLDGQPRLESAITPYKGSSTVSPFVALATRS